MSSNVLRSELRLPCGAILKNRLVKAAMNEYKKARPKHYSVGTGLNDKQCYQKESIFKDISVFKRRG